MQRPGPAAWVWLLAALVESGGELSTADIMRRALALCAGAGSLHYAYVREVLDQLLDAGCVTQREETHGERLSYVWRATPAGVHHFTTTTQPLVRLLEIAHGQTRKDPRSTSRKPSGETPGDPRRAPGRRAGKAG